MNSFLLRCAIACLFLNPFSSIAQFGSGHSGPLGHVRLMGGDVFTNHSILLGYNSPFGIKSLKDLTLAYNRPVPGGFGIAGLNAFGIRGFLQYRAELAYVLTVGESLHAGLGLLADFYPSCGQLKSGVIPGSSFYLDYLMPGKFRVNIYFDNWTGLWASLDYPRGEARFSVISQFHPREDIGIMASFSIAKARFPLYSIGIAIKAGGSHQLMAGIKSGPAGFWFAYRYSRGRLELIISLSTGSTFGYEPGSSFRYHIN